MQSTSAAGGATGRDIEGDETVAASRYAVNRQTAVQGFFN
jgi:hypothetical protein